MLLCFWNTWPLHGQNVIPNAGFESWVDLDTFISQKPENWRPDSTISYLKSGLQAPVFKSNDAADGDFSLGLKNIYSNGIYQSDSIRCTFIFKGRPGSIMGNFKNTAGKNIKLRIALNAKDANSQSFLLSNDSIYLTDTGGWRPFILPIRYFSGDISYKAEICIFSSGGDTTGYSLIDRLSFSTYNVVNFISDLPEEDYIHHEIFQADGRFYSTIPESSASILQV